MMGNYVRIQYSKAMELAEAEDFGGAEEILHSLIRIAPEYAGSYWMLGSLPTFKKLKGCAGPDDTPENQLSFYRKAVELAPDTAHYQQTLGSHLCQMGEFSEGHEVLTKAHRLNPTLIMGEIAEREIDLSELSEAKNAFSIFGLSILYEIAGRGNDARELRERMFKANIQVDLLIAGKNDEAERVSREMLELDPENAAAWMVLGSVMNNREEWKEAEGYFRKALDILYEFPHAWLGLATALLHQERFEEADEADKKAKLFEWNMGILDQSSEGSAPQSEADKWFEKAKEYSRDRKFKKAEKAFRKALEIAPERSDIFDEYMKFLNQR